MLRFSRIPQQQVSRDKLKEAIMKFVKFVLETLANNGMLETGYISQR